MCDAAKDLLVDGMKMKTAVIMSEDAAWTKPLDAGYEECLPKAGLKVLDHIRFSPDTTDFTPIFNNLEGKKPDVIVTGISHVGVQPTVQWKNQQVPIPMFGISAQALSPTFWARHQRLGGRHSVAGGRNLHHRGDAEDQDVRRGLQGQVRYRIRPIPATPPMTMSTSSPTRSSAPARPIRTRWSPSSRRPTTSAPSAACSSTDATTSSPTASNTDPDNVSGMIFQWQDGKQVTVWPAKIADGKMKYPSFARPTN